jgi:hypothetical protein
MKFRTLLARFRRKPLTPESARDLVAAASDRALDDGHGLCFAAFTQTDTQNVQFILTSKGDITDMLAHFLEVLLSSPETKDSARRAMIEALMETGGAGVVQLMPAGEDCDCPLCTIRREGSRRTKRRDINP